MQVLNTTFLFKQHSNKEYIITMYFSYKLRIPYETVQSSPTNINTRLDSQYAFKANINQE